MALQVATSKPLLQWSASHGLGQISPFLADKTESCGIKGEGAGGCGVEDQEIAAQNTGPDDICRRKGGQYMVHNVQRWAKLLYKVTVMKS
jgi:hypothetical protein